MPRPRSPPWWRGCARWCSRSAGLFADETMVPVLDPGRGRTKKGYFWAIARDDRPWGGRDPPAVVYSYAPGRSGSSTPSALLGSYRGILQTDGYAAYKQPCRSHRAGDDSLTFAFCWATCAAASSTLPSRNAAPIASEAL